MNLLFLTLSSDLFCMRDAAMLDNAMCCRNDREQFITDFYSNSIFQGFVNICTILDGFNGSDFYPSDLYLSWLVLRKIKIRHIQYKLVKTEPTHDYFLVCPHLTSALENFSITLPDHPERPEMELVAHNMPNLTSLKLFKRFAAESQNSIEYFTKHCPKLTSLDLSGCVDLGDEAVRIIFRNCTRLQTLKWNLSR